MVMTALVRLPSPDESELTLGEGEVERALEIHERVLALEDSLSGREIHLYPQV